MKLIISAFSVLIFLSTVTFANIRFNVTTDRNNVSMGEQILITAKVITTQKVKNLSTPQVPSSPNFKVLRTSQNQSSSTSIQIINGKTTRTVETTYLYYYYITPLKKESFTFPSLTLKADEKEYKSAPFRINVGTGPAKKKPITFKIDLSKSSPYKGEQVILTAKIIQESNSNIDLPSNSFMNAIETIEKTFSENFSINRLFTNKLSQSNSVVNGKQVTISSLSFSLIPLKDGKLTLPSIPFEYHELRRVQGRSRDPFDSFFGGSIFGASVQRVPATVFSGKRTINVKSLPLNAPQSFNGAVGSFKLKTDLSASTIPAGESVTLKLDISGNTRSGNLSDITLEKNSKFEIFTPEKHTYIDTTNNGIFTRKTFKYLIIPEEEGTHNLPVAEWTYFDVNEEKYKTLSTKNLQINVTKGKEKKDKGQNRYLTHEEIREVGTDIRYIKTDSKLREESYRPYASPTFLLTFPIPFIIALFSFLYRIQGSIINQNPENKLKRRAYSDAMKEISTAKSNIKEDETIASLSKILEKYIRNKFKISATGSTLSDLKNELNKTVSDESITNKVIPFIEKLDGFRFSGMKSDTTAISNTVNELEDIIKGLNSKEVKK